MGTLTSAVIAGEVFTVIGASGYLGTALASHLERAGARTLALGRADPPPENRDLGHVIDCAGLTSNFRARPLDTIEAHVCRTVDLLPRTRFESLLYLSSTRVYAYAEAGHEDSALQARPTDPDGLLALSKLAGEAACLALERPTIRVARLATVYGGTFASPNFLCSLLARMTGQSAIALRADPATTRDYIHVDDVVEALPRIALAGARRVYNVASGGAVRNDALVAGIAAHTGCRVHWEPADPVAPIPPISIDRLRTDLGLAPRSLADTLGAVVDEYRRAPAVAR
jgi:nucleoside-diphosphate-sugar epimerase